MRSSSGRLALILYALFTLLFGNGVNALQAPPIAVEIVRHNTPAGDRLPSASSSSLASSSSSSPSWIGALSSSIHLSVVQASTAVDGSNSNTLLSPSIFKTWKKDKVVRVMDANTVKLDKHGLVTLSGMQMPSVSANFQFPECFDKSPSYKIRKLLPAGTAVRVQAIATSAGTTNALLVVDADGTLVNAALVEAGFGRLKEKSAKQAESIVPDLAANLAKLQQRAQTLHLGMYKSCEAGSRTTLEVVTATFEPLEPEEPVVIPPNPGDRRNCADFETYEDALRYYETFLPYYGDVARLDRDNDGVPCPGLAHTTNPDLYRMKVPKGQQGVAK